MRLNSIPDSEGDSAGSGDVCDQLGATGRKFFLDMLAWLFHQRTESFRVDYRIAPLSRQRTGFGGDAESTPKRVAPNFRLCQCRI